MFLLLGWVPAMFSNPPVVSGNISLETDRRRWGGLLLGRGGDQHQPPTSNGKCDLASFALEVFGGGVIFDLCRFTNFIAEAAVRTAKSSFVPAIGRAPSVRSAAQPSWKRNSRRLRPRMRGAGQRPRRRSGVAEADVAQAAGATEDSRVKWVNC